MPLDVSERDARAQRDGRRMATPAAAQAPQLTGRQVAAALVAILLLALVMPPSAAWMVNRSRVRRAEADVSRLATALRTRRVGRGFAVVLGPGNVPQAAAGSAWLRGPADSLLNQVPGFVARADPWNNSYVAAVGPCAPLEHAGPAPRAGWVLSAGPNGIIETAYDQPADRATVGGDDIAVPVCE